MSIFFPDKWNEESEWHKHNDIQEKSYAYGIEWPDIYDVHVPYAIIHKIFECSNACHIEYHIKI